MFQKIDGEIRQPEEPMASEEGDKDVTMRAAGGVSPLIFSAIPKTASGISPGTGGGIAAIPPFSAGVNTLATGFQLGSDACFPRRGQPAQEHRPW